MPKIDRFKPVERNGKWMLLDTLTGATHLHDQGFGVCDQTADALNFGNNDPCGEIEEVADSIRKSLKNSKFPIETK